VTHKVGQGSMSTERRLARARKAGLASAKKRQIEGWKPNDAQVRALEAVAEDLSLANNPQKLAEHVEVNADTIRRWRRDPRFLPWWNNEVLALAKLHTAPAMVRLIGIIQHPDTPDPAAIKAIDSLMRHVPIEQHTHAADSILGLLERWKGRRLRAAIEIERDAPSNAQNHQIDRPLQLVEYPDRCDESVSEHSQGARHSEPKGRTTAPRIRVEVAQDADQLREMGALVAGPLSLAGAARRALDEVDDESDDESDGSSPAVVADDSGDGDAGSTEGVGTYELDAGEGDDDHPGSDHIYEPADESMGGNPSEITNRPRAREVADTYDESGTAPSPPAAPSEPFGAGVFDDTDYSRSRLMRRVDGEEGP